ncbi:MAG: hypothetical protein ACI97P_001679 [Arcticibacterium sp.]|jgi:hypothetical protein
MSRTKLTLTISDADVIKEAKACAKKQVGTFHIWLKTR